ncbi:MAG: hypothetical protein IPO37_25590 [Saprospiraceae bacterium]|nr:hypothetical protein [Saprospiraceae bacterium]
MTNTLADIVQSGIVGETQNALIAYLAYTSRKREKPLHIICLGASGTGKTYLQEKISELIPEEEKIEITTPSHSKSKARYVSAAARREKEFYDDNANRSILLYIDDSPEQDKKDHGIPTTASAGQINTGVEATIREQLKNVPKALATHKSDQSVCRNHRPAAGSV